ncbi:MAG: PAS domain S-box protein [Elusimicrobia bacterium]|nr:PAS domain S-box protein [Elusimicrobiota bacterium]
MTEDHDTMPDVPLRPRLTRPRGAGRGRGAGLRGHRRAHAKAELLLRAKSDVSRIDPETWRFLYARALEDLAVMTDICRRQEELHEAMPVSEGAKILICVKDIASIVALITQTPRDRLVFVDHAPMETLVRELFIHQVADDLRVMDLMITLSSLRAPGRSIPLELVEKIHRRSRTVRSFLERVSAVSHPMAPGTVAAPSGEEFRRLYASFSDGLVFMDTLGDIIEANPAFQEMLGYGEGEIRRLTVRGITPEKWHGLEDIIIHERLARQGHSEEYDKELIRKDGVVLPVSVKTWLSKDERGVVSGMWSIVRNISERKRAEDLLEAESFRNRMVIQKMRDGVTVSDAAGRFEVFNDRMRELTGYSLEEANASLDFAALIHPDPRERAVALAPLSTLQRGKSPIERETVIRCKDGTSKNLLVATSLIRFGGREMYLSVWRDVTARRLAEERVARQAAMLHGIVALLQTALSARSQEDLGRACLAVASEISGSRFGFILELNELGSVDSIAVSDPGWKACKMPVTNAVVMLRNMPVRGIWARAIREGRSVIVNDPSTHPDRVGTPPGHPAVECFLGVPLISKGRTTGIIGVANKPGGYTAADRQDLETLAAVFVEALAGQRSKERHDHLWSIIEASVNEILIFDPVTLKIEHANSGALRNTGYTLDEIRRLRAIDLKPHMDEAAFWLMVAPLMRDDKKAHVFQTVQQRKDGTLYDVEAHLQLVKRGEQLSFVCIAEDITESKRTREDLRRSEMRFRRIFETSEDGMLILEPETGTILDSNPFIQDLLGRCAGELTGRKLWEIGLFPTQAEAERVLAETREQHGARRDALSVMTADGRELAVEFSARFFEFELRQAVHCVVRDVTIRRHAEEKIKEIVDAKAKFAAMVSHELRTPLTVIKECISLLAEGFSGRASLQQSELIDICQRNISRLTRLINSVLDYQSSAAGGMRYEFRENDVNSVAREVGQALEPLATKKGLMIELSLGDIPSLLFDRDKIVQALTNLAANAVRCTERGQVAISTTLDVDGVRVSVRDTGRGIAHEDLPKLFQSFQRLGERSEGGTGLGLAITKQIIEHHHGRIWAESRPGQGSVFHFTLPALRH